MDMSYKRLRHWHLQAVGFSFILFFFLFLTSCGSDHEHFSVDGRLLNVNTAEFLVYSPDGILSGIDTIKVNGGRFTYERPIMNEGTIVIVFPNFKQIPIFVKPGADISFDGSAAKLKDIEVTGTDENDEFTEWRLNTNELSPKELESQAQKYVKENPGTLISLWLQRQYLPIKVSCSVGDRLPAFSAKDINGKTVSSNTLMKGNSLIVVWASWNYDSQSMLRQVNNKDSYIYHSYNSDKDKNKKKISFDNIISICLDADVKKCRQILKQCEAENVPTICDGKMLDGNIVKTLGINNIPDNIRLKNGKITGRAIPIPKLAEE